MDQVTLLDRRTSCSVEGNIRGTPPGNGGDDLLIMGNKKANI